MFHENYPHVITGQNLVKTHQYGLVRVTSIAPIFSSIFSGGTWSRFELLRLGIWQLKKKRKEVHICWVNLFNSYMLHSRVGQFASGLKGPGEAYIQWGQNIYTVIRMSKLFFGQQEYQHNYRRFRSSQTRFCRQKIIP